MSVGRFLCIVFGELSSDKRACAVLYRSQWAVAIPSVVFFPDGTKPKVDDVQMNVIGFVSRLIPLSLYYQITWILKISLNFSWRPHRLLWDYWHDSENSRWGLQPFHCVLLQYQESARRERKKLKIFLDG